VRAADVRAQGGGICGPGGVDRAQLPRGPSLRLRTEPSWHARLTRLTAWLAPRKDPFVPLHPSAAHPSMPSSTRSTRPRAIQSARSTPLSMPPRARHSSASASTPCRPRTPPRAHRAMCSAPRESRAACGRRCSGRARGCTQAPRPRAASPPRKARRVRALCPQGCSRRCLPRISSCDSRSALRATRCRAAAAAVPLVPVRRRGKPARGTVATLVLLALVLCLCRSPR
jgi:hypothetical protein